MNPKYIDCVIRCTEIAGGYLYKQLEQIYLTGNRKELFGLSVNISEEHDDKYYIRIRITSTNYNLALTPIYNRLVACEDCESELGNNYEIEIMLPTNEDRDKVGEFISCQLAGLIEYYKMDIVVEYSENNLVYVLFGKTVPFIPAFILIPKDN